MTEHPIKALGDMLRKAKPPRRHEPGELDGNGYCLDCKLGPFGPGQYYCLACTED